MVKYRKKKMTPVEQEEQYVAFLKRRLESENFQANATSEEIELTEKKYDKAKFKLKMLRLKG